MRLKAIVYNIFRNLINETKCVYTEPSESKDAAITKYLTVKKYVINTKKNMICSR